MEHLKDIVWGGAYAADANGYGRRMGYVGPALSDVTGRDVANVADDLRLLMQVKSSAEVALIRASCDWGHLAHSRLERYSRAGAAEYEVAVRASLEATVAMVDTLGQQYARDNPFPLEAHAGFRGQVGANSAIPHATTIHAIMRVGDTLVTGAAGRVWGYNSELERTMFVGEPSADQRRYFDAMLVAQDAAFAAIRPGRPVSDVDNAAQAVFRDAGVAEYVRHHTGHSIGMDGHESPFFDAGDPTVMRPGMVFSVEPGIYVPGLGGFRHSDTVVVTDSGHERLSLYPRDLESLVCA
jgi:Xaa-Pro aminopeptidase